MKRLAEFLGINAQTGALLLAILFVGIGEELWLPFVPKYIKASGGTIFTVALYAAGINLLEGFYFFLGGSLAERFGVRRSMALFALVPLAGYAIFLSGGGPWVAVAGTLAIAAWEPLVVPATFDVVGSALKESKRTMAFAVQSIQKRLPKIVGPAVGGVVLFTVGVVNGTRACLWVSLVFVGFSLVTQLLLLKDVPRKGPPASLGAALRAMDPFLKRLLVAEVLVRWCDWLIREFIVLYVIEELCFSSKDYGFLRSFMMIVSLITYLPIGWLADRTSPPAFVRLTFFFFAAFPLALSFAHTMPMLVAAFALWGLREIGEPARKAIITSRFAPEVRARAVGAYWGIRAFLIWPAPILGAWIWKEHGPEALMRVAAGLGAAAFFVFLFAEKWIGGNTGVEGGVRESTKP